MFSIIIVNYHKATRASESLAALQRQTLANVCRICIIDNSVDAAEASILAGAVSPPAQLIIASENLGYTKAVNLGVRTLGTSDFIALVSPDIILEDPASLEKMSGILDARPDIGLLATLQKNDDGSRVEVARRYPSFLRQVLRRLRPGRYGDDDLLAPLWTDNGPELVYPDWAQSSFVMLRRADWDVVRGLDERFFLFMADIEISRRLKNIGKKNAVTRSVIARADGVRASHGGLMDIFSSKSQRIHLKDALTYYRIRTQLNS